MELIPNAGNGSVWMFKQGQKPKLVPAQQFEVWDHQQNPQREANTMKVKK